MEWFKTRTAQASWERAECVRKDGTVPAHTLLRVSPGGSGSESHNATGWYSWLFHRMECRLPLEKSTCDLTPQSLPTYPVHDPYLVWYSKMPLQGLLETDTSPGCAHQTHTVETPVSRVRHPGKQFLPQGTQLSAASKSKGREKKEEKERGGREGRKKKPSQFWEGVYSILKKKKIDLGTKKA